MKKSQGNNPALAANPRRVCKNGTQETKKPSDCIPVPKHLVPYIVNRYGQKRVDIWMQTGEMVVV